MCCTLESTLSNDELFLEQASCEYPLFLRTSSCCRSEKKSGGEEGNRAACLLLVPSQLSFTCFIYFLLNDQGKLVIR